MSDSPVLDIIPAQVPAVSPVQPWVRQFSFSADAQEDALVEIWPNSETKVMATAKMVREMLCPHIPVKDAIRFLLQCRSACLDPFAGEIIITDRLNEKGGRDYYFVIRQQSWRRLAAQHRDFLGMTYEEFPEPDDSYVPVIKGVCKVWRKNAPEPYRQVCYLEEVGTDIGKGGVIKRKGGFWSAQPREALRGCTEARALRHVFADQFSGFYDSSEVPNG